MANVLFKRGLSTGLPTQAQDGVFYLTTDTNRLYVGNGTTLAELNRYVKVVADLTELYNLGSKKDDFVFVSDGSMLLVCVDSDNSNVASGWLQINSPAVIDSNDDTEVTGITFDKEAQIKNENGDLVLPFKIAQTKTDLITGSKTVLSPLNGEIIIDKDAFATMTVDVAVGINATLENNIATIKTNGTGAAGEGFTIVGENGVSIDGSDNELTISGTTYDLKVENTTIGLVDNDNANTNTKVSIIGDEDWITVSNSNGNIKIAHNSKTVNAPAASNGGVLEDQDTFTVVTGLTVDDNNHVTDIEKTVYTIQDTTYTPGIELDSNKDLIVSLEDENGVKLSTSPLDISFKVTVDNNAEATIIKPGSNLGNIYSKEKIDNLLYGLNAMTYKGVVNSDEELPDTGSIGDTYKVGTDFGDYLVGDLLILNTIDVEQYPEENGVVPTGYVKWDRIESGEAADTTYDLIASNNEIVLTDSHNSSDKITIQDDDIVILTATNNILKGQHKTFVKATATPEEKATVGYGGSITAITGITTDGYGHTTGYATQEFTIPNNDQVVAEAANAKLILQDGNGSVQGSIDLNASEEITVTGTSSDEKNLVATIAHKKVTKNNTTGTATPAHNGNFTVVESVTYNDYGHVSGVKTTTVTLPKETTYEMDGVNVTNNTAKWELKDNNGAVKGDAIEVTSSSLAIATSGTKAAINIEWGAF